MTVSIRAGTSNDGYLQINGADVAKLIAGGTVAGLRDKTIATMKMFADEFPKGAGWQKLTNGLYVQWGGATAYGNNVASPAYFPIAFPSGPVAATACVNGSGFTDATIGAVLVNNTYMNLYNSSSGGAQNCMWIAIGY
jgi:hypothetical protein